MPLQDRIGLEPNLTILEELGEVDKFSCTSPGSLISDEGSSLIQKADLRYMRCWCDMRLLIKVDLTQRRYGRYCWTVPKHDH